MTLHRLALLVLLALLFPACAAAAPAPPTLAPPRATCVPLTATAVPPTPYPTAGPDESIPCVGHDLVHHARLATVLPATCVLEGPAYKADPGLLWGWDGAAWRLVSANGPPGRGLGGVALHPPSDRLLLLGGRSMLEDFVDFWSWDGTTWQRFTGPVPGPRSHSTLANDPGRDRVVLNGGIGPDDTLLHDTWEWDGQAWNCAAKCP